MYNTEDLVGEVVTIKLSSGLEILASLQGVDEEFKFLTVTHPRNLVINGDDGKLALVPYIFTAKDDEVIINTTSLVSVNATSKESKEDYLKIVETGEPLDEEDTEE
jgi:hypothetical protein